MFIKHQLSGTTWWNFTAAPACKPHLWMWIWLSGIHCYIVITSSLWSACPGSAAYSY